MHIRAATSEDAQTISHIVAGAFHDVALRFGLTKANCPTHPSFYTAQKVVADWAKGINYDIAELDGSPVGCVAIEQPSAATCYLERLAVQPQSRRRGIGRALVERVFEEAAARGAKEVGIAIIAEHTELCAWYAKIGFNAARTRRFAHLPFTVMFLTYRLT